MFANIIRVAAIIFLYALISGLASGTAADFAAHLGGFGSCFEGACGYGAVFLGVPAFWFVFFVLLFMSREWPLGRFSRGWRRLIAALLIFPVVGSLGFAVLLSLP